VCVCVCVYIYICVCVCVCVCVCICTFIAAWITYVSSFVTPELQHSQLEYNV